MKTIKVKFVDFFQKFNEKENWIFKFLSRHYDVQISPNPDVIFFSVWGKENLNFNCVKVFLTGENVRPNFKLTDFAIGFDFLDKDNFLRLPLYVNWRSLDHKKLLLPEFQNIIDTNPKSKFCCFLISNSDSKERIKFFHKLNNYKKIDSGGRVLNNIGYQVTNKLDFISPYKFMIAYENSSFPGYVTEKIYECFFANVIPIYWGSDRIGEDFNEKRILCRHNFSSDAELIEEIIRLDNDPMAYFNFINQPVFNENVPTLYFDESRLIKFFNQVFNYKSKYSDYVIRKVLGNWIWIHNRISKKIKYSG